MWVTEMIPRSLDRVDADSPDADAWIAGRYPRTGTHSVRVNMVTSLTGSAAGSDGTSDTLTSALDRRILRAIRAAADVVVVGAATVRAEGYIVPRSAHLAVVTRSGDLSGHRFDESDLGRVIAVTPDDIPSDALPAGIRQISAGVRLSPAGIVYALSREGLDHVVCEGGPTLAGEFVSAGIIDEICVTVAPALTRSASRGCP